MALIQLNKTIKEDLPNLFKIQTDKEVIFQAAFTPLDPFDLNVYVVKHTMFLSDPAIHSQTIRINDINIGSIAKYEICGEAEITYWIDKKY